ncbi:MULTISPECIES: hypothetical protein [Pacificimonas]|uniref:Uncharacterized protein n=1 Tax=Pacificimonas aurantium TaxID=1250540 RepID=A0ABS7WR63_9SPHN|nr:MULTISPECIES: hypothetical protein [Pacificimonas]MBZ6380103.1 hypothetical protein [Pacificimonas aurantium]
MRSFSSTEATAATPNETAAGAVLLPLPSRRHPVNRMSVGARFAWVLGIAVSAAVGFGGIMAGLSAIGSLF